MAGCRRTQTQGSKLQFSLAATWHRPTFIQVTRVTSCNCCAIDDSSNSNIDIILVISSLFGPPSISRASRNRCHSESDGQQRKWWLLHRSIRLDCRHAADCSRAANEIRGGNQDENNDMPISPAATAWPVVPNGVVRRGIRWTLTSHVVNECSVPRRASLCVADWFTRRQTTERTGKRSSAAHAPSLFPVAPDFWLRIRTGRSSLARSGAPRETRMDVDDSYSVTERRLSSAARQHGHLLLHGPVSKRRIFQCSIISYYGGLSIQYKV